jgi:hypothetical protein
VQGPTLVALVLHLKSENVERILEPATVPSVCPDLPR